MASIFRGAGRLRLALLWGLCGMVPSLAAPGAVVLEHAPATPLRQRIEEHLGAVISELDTGELAGVESAFTAAGLAAARELLSRVRLRNARPVHRTRLLQLPGSSEYEVRDIRVQVEMGETPGSPYQHLVFTLVPDGRIADVRFAVEPWHYEELVGQPELLQDFVQRQQILQCVELFRTAYNRRDLAFIEKIFSDEALIIVGRVVRQRPDLPGQEGRLTGSLLGQERVEFIRRSKHEYLETLRQAFQRNDFLSVEFDSLQVTPHPRDTALYGVTLKQHWRSSTYSDTGYLFLLMDFAFPDEPLIHVRSWQPERFKDGSLVSLEYFDIIRAGSR